jgi:hypothetical protein
MNPQERDLKRRNEMFKSVSPKAIALGGITFAGLGVIGIGVETTKAVLFEIQNARAATTAALANIEISKAEMEKARAERASADASRLDAENKLLAAVEARNGALGAAQFMAGSERYAADRNSDSLVHATEIDRFVDNEMYSKFTEPLLEPFTKISQHNSQMVRLQHEAETGIDSKTRRFLTESEKADRLAQARILGEEVTIESKISGKNVGDMFNAMFGGVAGMGGLFPTGNEPKTTRRIVQE